MEFKYDVLNRVTERMNSNGTGILYSYTPRGEVESIINYSGQGRDRVIGSYGYLYNAKGQRIYQLEDDGDLTAYAYDPAGRVKEVYYPFEDKKKVEDLKERADYGLLTQCNEPCKFTLNIPNLSWNELENLNAQINELNASFNSHFKKKSNQPKEVELIRGPKSLKFSNRLNPDHQNRNKLDNLFRKIREGSGYLNTGKDFWKEEYTYDPNGNILEKRNGWGSIEYRYNQANQLLQVGNRAYQYDPEGNLVKEILGSNEIIYRYDYENRLTRANHKYENFLSGREFTGKISYGYDALGRRVKKESAPAEGPENEVEYYVYNGLGLDILAEYHDDYKSNGKPNPAGKPDQVIEYYYGNGMMLASKKLNDPSNRRWEKDPLKDVTFYHQDVLGSVVLITGKDGHVDERYQYDIWGKVYDGKLVDDPPGSGQKNNVVGFTGQRYQVELGIYSFAFRDYNPKTMRWMTEDPVKDGWNWYTYCGEDPVNFVDFLGLDSVTTLSSNSYQNKVSTNNTVLFPGVYHDSDTGFPAPVATVVKVSTETTTNVKSNELTVNINVSFSAVTSVTSDWGGSGATEQVTVTVTGKILVTDDGGTPTRTTDFFNSTKDDSTVYKNNFTVGYQIASNDLDNPPVKQNDFSYKINLPVESIIDTKPDLLSIKVEIKIDISPELAAPPFNVPVTAVYRRDGDIIIPVANINVDEPGGADYKKP